MARTQRNARQPLAISHQPPAISHQLSATSHLLFFQRATDPQEGLAAGALLCSAADFELSASGLVLSVLDCAYAPAGRDFARPVSRYHSAGRVAEVDPGHALAGISAWVCLRRAVVSGHLLLGVRHDASVRRAEC